MSTSAPTRRSTRSAAACASSAKPSRTSRTRDLYTIRSIAASALEISSCRSVKNPRRNRARCSRRKVLYPAPSSPLGGRRHPQRSGREMAEIIDGKKVAEDVVATVKKASEELTAKGVTPGLAVIIVAEDPASQVYVASKSKKAKECGFKSVQHTLPAETSQAELVKLIDELNADSSIHGILVQLPLPGHIDSGAIIQAIAPEKDVDGFTFANVGKLGTGEVNTAFVPCTPAG